MRIFGPLICGLLAVLLLSSCSTQKSPPSALIYGFKANRAEFNLGDDSRFKFEPLNVTSDRQSRLVIAYTKYDRASGKKLGDFFRVSHDGGASLDPEQKSPFVFSIGFRGWALAFTKGGLAAVYTWTRERQNLFYVRSEDDGATWSEPVQINDEQDSVSVGGGGGFSFIQPSENEIDCVWTDARRGFWLTFFSASHDGGRA